MTPEREREYNELLGYVRLFATAVWQIDPASGIHPADVINGIAQQFGRSKALVGLRQAANDTIEGYGRRDSERMSATRRGGLAGAAEPPPMKKREHDKRKPPGDRWNGCAIERFLA